MWAVCQRLSDGVMDAGGRFYYAKDALIPQPASERVHGSEAVRTFRSLKARCDPRGMLQTDLSRRLMA